MLRGAKVTFMRRIGEGGQEAEIWHVNRKLMVDQPLAFKFVVFPYTEQSLPSNIARANLIRRIESTAMQKFGAATAHVVRLIDEIEDLVVNDGERYVIVGIMMELSPFGDLLHWRRTQDPSQIVRGPLRQLFADVAKGLKAGHDNDVVHCDVKPSNVLLFTQDDRIVAKVMDFGAAYDPQNPTSSDIGGTPEYMAPERLNNPSSEPTPESDVYSLGVTFYEIITGTLPIQARGEDRILAYAAAIDRSEVDYTPVRTVFNERMARLIHNMMEKSPEKRPTIAQVISSLESQSRESLVAEGSNPKKVYILEENCFRWNPELHVALGHRLNYFLVGGYSDVSSVQWWKNRLATEGVCGYSINRVLGGYDYLIRVWLSERDTIKVDAMVEAFSKTDGARLSRLRVSDYELWFGKDEGKLKSVTQEDAFSMMTEAAKFPARSDQLSYLCKMGAVHSLLFGGQGDEDASSRTSGLSRAKKTPMIRFFVTIGANERLNEWLMKTVSQSVENALLRMKDAGHKMVHDLSIYRGVGDNNWCMLVKFRTKKFFDFAQVRDRIVDCTSQIGRGLIFSSQTFVEPDYVALTESDEGPIIRDASKFVSGMLD